MWRLQLKQALANDRNRRFVAFLAVFVILLPLLILSVSREVFTYATETDFLQTFVPEAERILAGQPLEVSYHLPGFPLVLAGVMSLVPDLLTAGLVIALVASIVALWVNFKAYQSLFGQDYGWASVFTLWLSIPLLILSASATSDVYFYLLFSAALWLAILVAKSPNAPTIAIGLGLVIGVAFLTRSNGLTLFAALLMPFVTLRSLRGRAFWVRLKSAGIILVASLIPVLIWLFVSVRYGMPFSPSGTVDNLAMTYFSSGDGIGLESMEQVRGKFDSVMDVLLHDPAAVISQYARDLFNLPLRVLKSTAFPFSLIALPGLVLLLLKRNRIFYAVLALFFLPQILLVNLKTFEPRYYLFLAPLVTISMYEAVKWGAQALTMPSAQRIYRVAVIACIGFASFASVRYAHTYVHAQNKEIGSLAAHTRAMDLDGHVLVSRKIQSAYYTGTDHSLLLGADDLEALLASLTDIQARTGQELLFYYGGMEHWKWPDLLNREAPETAPSWLTVLACSDDPEHAWCLYRFTP